MNRVLTSILIGLIAFVIALFGLGKLTVLEERAAQERLRASVFQETAHFRSDFEAYMEARAAVAENLARDLSLSPGQSEPNQTTIDAIMQRLSDVEYAIIWKDGQITKVYARKEKPFLNGIQVRAVAKTTEAMYVDTLYKNKTLIRGPVVIPHAFSGFAVFTPVLISSGEDAHPEIESRGAVSLFCSAQAAPAWHAMLRKRATLDLAVTSLNTSGQTDFFWGNAVLAKKTPLRSSLSVPGGNWQLASAPIGGWNQNAGPPSNLVYRMILAVLIGLIAALVALYPQHLKHTVARITADLRRSEERWELALLGANDGIFDWETRRETLFFSDQAANLFGYTIDEFPKNIPDFVTMIHLDDQLPVQAELARHLQKRSEYFTVECRFRARNGCYRWMMIRGRGIWNEHDNPIRITGSISDISRQKEYENDLLSAREQLEQQVAERTVNLTSINQALTRSNQALEQEVQSRVETEFSLAEANRELRQKIDQLHAAQDELIRSEKMASLGQLMAGIAHEINTPVGISVTAITNMDNLTNTFEDAFENGSARRQDLADFLNNLRTGMAIAAANLIRAAEMIRSFKEVSADRTSEQRREFNVLKYINEILLSLQPKLKKTPHKIVVVCRPDLSIDSYPGAYAHILSNMVMNSLLHAFPDNQPGTIRIEATVEGNDFHLTFSDDGCGMDKTVAAQIFDPFFTTKRSNGGTGLGMHIVNTTVTLQLHGKIDLITAPGAGTRFEITVPLAQGPCCEDEGGVISWQTN
ncbi:MAG: ATP-binding protein [Solirubrobacterales bacterium]